MCGSSNFSVTELLWLGLQERKQGGEHTTLFWAANYFCFNEYVSSAPSYLEQESSQSPPLLRGR